jgi:hypothetical protein
VIVLDRNVEALLGKIGAYRLSGLRRRANVHGVAFGHDLYHKRATSSVLDESDLCFNQA